jgi:inositol-pentakisphosphate 2-kinase
MTKVPPCPPGVLLCSEYSSLPEEVLQMLARTFVDQGSSRTSPQQQRRFAEWLRTNHLLRRLHDFQITLDRQGPLATDPLNPDFTLAMTLRDCSCFLRIPEDAERPVEAKLGDLDKKNSEAKVQSWQAIEIQLAVNGYYQRVKVPRQRTRCLYEWEEWASTTSRYSPPSGSQILVR